MKVPLAWVLLVPLACTPTFAQDVLLPGFGNYPWTPVCAQACLQAFRSYWLNCTDLERAKKPYDPVNLATPPSCYVSSPVFLTSAAWCFYSRCSPDITIASLEAFWRVGVPSPGGLKHQPPPMWSYTVALDKVDPKPPKNQLVVGDIWLNETSLLPEVAYVAAANGMVTLIHEQVNESKFSITLLVFALGLPIFLTWAIRWLPFVETLSDKIKPYLVYPSTIGTYHTRSLPFQLGNVPTLGQTLYIVLFIILNIILSAVGYKSWMPNAFYITQYKEILNHITIRTGAFAFVLLPVLFLFSSRNNILLYLTGWSHSTYLLLHRWVARLFMVHVVIHSIAAFQVYRFFETTPWWYWGVAGTVLVVVLTIASGLYVRGAQYELFLVSHIVLTVLMLVASWYHLVGWYELLGMSVATKNTYGYEIWFYFAIAVWFFDRLARVFRVVRWGPKRATVTEIPGTTHHVRIDIPGVRWGMDPARHAFVYFPTLRPWSPWENHPFSIVPTYLLQQQQPRGSGSDTGSITTPVDDEEKQLPKTGISTLSVSAKPMTTTGITLFLNKASGITRYLQSNSRLLTFLDGPYPSASTTDLLRCDRLLIISGGIGITAALPWAHSHLNAKLAWSVKEADRGLADTINLAGVANKDVRIGTRFNLHDLVTEEENAGWSRVGVFVCGPGSLCDDVRAAVAAAGKRGKTVFELEIDSFAW